MMDAYMIWKILAWACLLFIVIATLGPIGTRPVTGFSVTLERFAAFGVLGSLFTLAYPKQIYAIAMFLVLAVVFLETFQLLSPGRHGRIVDVVEKSAGVLVGIAIVWLSCWIDFQTKH